MSGQPPSGRLKTVLHGLRQRRYPPEFRIAASVWPLEPPPIVQDAPPEPPPKPPHPRDGVDPQALADAVTSLWRARRKLRQNQADGLPREVRQATRHLQSTWDALAEAGVELQEHDHALFDPGLSVEVIAFQPRPGIQRETIIETIKPTVYVNGDRIQMGQVVVGVPEEGNSS